ncbi:MAG TPA: proline dehydrogenase family protein [Thermodesulfobacteriota bacterium]|nr:proline dehydrogenase family protein [Thermodesulfobacteriota bacterium]
MSRILSYFAKRYIAGEKQEDAINTAKELNERGIKTTIDNLGEDVKDAKDAARGVEEYMSLVEAIRKDRVDANVSFKLTHLGLDISPLMAEENAETIIKKAVELKNFVWFDMEGSKHTENTLSIFSKLHAKYPETGIAIQSYLYRSAADVTKLIKENAAVRLVKGAYKESPDIAFPEKKDVDGNFSALMKRLLLSGAYTAIATHDEKLVNEAKNIASENKIPRDHFEFQMLLGIKRTLQSRLVEEGYKVRVYVPYGTRWLPYTMRRMTERKENVWFVLKNIFD